MDSLRVAILGRAGAAREQLRAALVENGVTPVVEGDPAELDPAEVARLRPQVLLIGLEPAIEDALDRFEALVDDAAVEVVFDDVEVTGELSGWERARWIRHLLAKLRRHDDVLPPPPEGAQALAVPGEGDARLAADGPEASGVSFRPAASAPGFRAGAVDAGSGAAASPDPRDPDDPHDTAARGHGAEDTALRPPESEDPLPVLESGGDRHDRAESFDPDAPEAYDFGDSLDDAAAWNPDAAPPSPHLRPAAAPEDAAPGLDDVLAAAGREAGPGAPVPPEARTRDEPGTGRVDFGVLELAPLDEAFSPPVPEAGARAFPAPGAYAELGLGLSLVPDERFDAAEPEADAPAGAAAETASGSPRSRRAIVLIAGLGGPDAARQFLAALPERLTVPILLWQHLDAGRHDRLVTQLAKASQLPVYLAQAGQVARPGQVGVLPGGLDVAGGGGDGLEFREGPGDVAALAGLDGAVTVLLSGAGIASVAPALAGGFALAQDPATCFDATAAEALAAGGARVAAPAQLAALAVERLTAQTAA